MKFTKKILPNGLTILHEKRDVPVTTVMLAAKYGSAYETIEEKGMAHFMEHLCFKGTEKRTVNQIAKEVEGVGGELNAFTHEEVTAYHVKLPSEHTTTAMEVIFDIFFNPTFPEEEVSKEANVICEEIKMYKDNPRSHVLENIKSCLYEAPFGLFIAGDEKNVRGMDRKMLLGKHDELYVPKNSILCVVGNNSFEEISKLAEELSPESNEFKLELPEIRKKVSQDSESRSNLNQTNLALGIHIPMETEKQKYAAEIFSNILGSGMSSRLFKEVREKRGLVYGVKSDLDIGKNYGYMIIWAGTDPEKRDEVFKICKEEFSKMSNLTEIELKEAKIQLIGNQYVGLEGSSDVAVNLIMEEISGDAEDFYKFEEKINQVTLEDIKEIANLADFSSFYLGPN